MSCCSIWFQTSSYNYPFPNSCWSKYKQDPINFFCDKYYSSNTNAIKIGKRLDFRSCCRSRAPFRLQLVKTLHTGKSGPAKNKKNRKRFTEERGPYVYRSGFQTGCRGLLKNVNYLSKNKIIKI